MPKNLDSFLKKIALVSNTVCTNLREVTEIFQTLNHENARACQQGRGQEHSHSKTKIIPFLKKGKYGLAGYR